MSDGFEQAKAQRNWLERLGEKIPGFSGFQDRELRREVDKREREHLASEVDAIKRALRQQARSFTDVGQLAALTPFERLERRLDGLAQAIRYADYGASGFFDAVKIGEAELARLYQFDLSLVDEIAALAGLVAAVPKPGGDSPAAALEVASEHLSVLETKWGEREQVVAGAASEA